ncbi:hypothetical protein MLD38_026121 [Melastoma candidum]|uniref:Uncharacterized protein n=1 Tax=Melastoma candidum TaxID=119954 RepID=A0ACB9NZ50_9MYRT|nr:hypothetical protein MLD38_026121 [Melastoma candidum]
MEKQRLIMLLALISAACVSILCNSGLTEAIESPHYKIVLLESDFHVRLYSKSVWISAAVDDLSFEKATLCGYARLFAYTQGANLNSSWLPPTVPVVTALLPGAGPLNSSAYSVRLYLPSKFQAELPSPFPELDLKPYIWPIRCVAVRRFYGFATNKSVVKEAGRLARSLSKSNITTGDRGYSVAQYSPPLQIIGRVNEVWVDVTLDEIDGCGTESETAGASAD